MKSILCHTSPSQCEKSELERRPEDECRPYYHYVKSLCGQWTRFRPLRDFMNLKFEQVKPKITVYDLSEDGHEEIRVEDLKDFLTKPPPNDKPTRLFVVQDLSPEVIELLGDKLCVDPAVFLTHIWTKNWYNKGVSQSLVSPSHSGMARQSFVRFRYVVAREARVEEPEGTKGDKEVEGTKEGKEVEGTNEGKDVKGTIKPGTLGRWASDNSCILRQILVRKFSLNEKAYGFARRQITMWVKPDANNKSSWTGMILVDPSVKLPNKSGLRWLGESYHPIFVPHPMYSPDRVAPGSDSTSDSDEADSMYNALSKYFTSKTVKECVNDPFAVTAYFLQGLVAEWHNVIHILQNQLSQVQIDIERNRDLLQKRNHSLQLHLLHRYCRRYSYFLQQAETICKERGPPDWTKTCATKKSAISQEKDFNRLYNLANGSRELTEQLLNVLLTTIQLEDAKRITQLTIAAFVFLPLSLVSSIMSMSSPFALNASQPWIYWVVAVPFALIVVFAGLKGGNDKSGECIIEDIESDERNHLGEEMDGTESNAPEAKSSPTRIGLEWVGLMKSRAGPSTIHEPELKGIV